MKKTEKKKVYEPEKGAKKPVKKRGLLGIWKGKLKYDDSIFNLG
jgi:hypothetical protein